VNFIFKEWKYFTPEVKIFTVEQICFINLNFANWAPFFGSKLNSCSLDEKMWVKGPAAADVKTFLRINFKSNSTFCDFNNSLPRVITHP